jgi:hypothetical protein
VADELGYDVILQQKHISFWLDKPTRSNSNGLEFFLHVLSHLQEEAGFRS